MDIHKYMRGSCVEMQGSFVEIQDSCADRGLFIQGAFAEGAVFLKNESATRPQTRTRGLIYQRNAWQRV